MIGDRVILIIICIVIIVAVFRSLCWEKREYGFPEVRKREKKKK